MAVVKFTVNEALVGLRLDIAALEAKTGLSRRKAKAIIDVGGAYINRHRIRRASHLVRLGDKVEMQYDEQALRSLRQPVEGLADKAICFEGYDLIVLNKPPGLPSQGTLDQDIRHVVPCLQDLLERQGRRPGKLILCHRLDKETSGLILVATNSEAATAMTDLFRQRDVQKTYHALVRGLPQAQVFAVDCHLSEPDQKTGLVRVVRAGGKASHTEFKVLERFPKAGMSLVACKPHTGRTHQIRVHLESLGLPIVGDRRYGRQLPSALAPELATGHHMLHALALELPITGVKGGLKLHAPYPETWVAALSYLRGQSLN